MISKANLKKLINLNIFFYVVWIVYAEYLSSSGVPPLEVGAGYLGLQLFQQIILIPIGLGIFGIPLITIMHAYQRGRYIWAFFNLNILISIYYTYFVFMDEDDEPSFMDITKKS